LFVGDEVATGAPTHFLKYRDWWIAPVDAGPVTRTGAFVRLRRDNITGLELNNLTPASWTAAGNRVFFSALSDGSRRLWTIPISAETGKVSGPAQVLTTGRGEESCSWVTEGGRLAFASLATNVDIWKLPVDTDKGKVLGELERVTKSPGREAQPSVSADGARLVFLTDRRGTEEVWLKDLRTGRESPVTEHPDGAPWRDRHLILSDDGSKIAFCRTELDGEFTYLQEIGTSSPRRLRDGWSNLWGWSSDGRQVLLWLDRIQPMCISVLDVSSGEAPTTILRYPKYSLQGAQFSPDDRWIAFSAVSRQAPRGSRLYIARYQRKTRVNWEDLIRVTDGRSWDEEPRWSPDGTLLYFLSTRGNFCGIWKQALDPGKNPAGKAEPVIQFRDPQLNPLNVVNLGRFKMSVTADGIFLNLEELSGNVWIAELEERY
jgi:Tol biopolymer transport system component